MWSNAGGNRQEMRLAGKILVGIVIVLILIQFIRPAKNEGGGKAGGDISQVVSLPTTIGSKLKASCYDCHSNHTEYPWYSRVQPVGWWLANHIKEGKAELNFNEFGSYSKRRQLSKLKGIGESIKDGSMPLSSYLWIHRDANLSAADKKAIIDWAEETRDSLTKIYEQ